MKPLVLDGIAQGARDGLLAGYFVKGLRAPLARDHLIRHTGLLFARISRQDRFLILLQQFPGND